MIKNIIKRGSDDEKKTEKQKVDERREEVLARGRKFKYPLQFARHKLVTVTIIIAVFAVLLMSFVGWFLLYKSQSDGDIIYRITRVVPVPVAKVDDTNVAFSDYLLIYRSNMKAVEQQSGDLGSGEEADAVRAQYKRAAMDQVEKYTYAKKIANELGIKIGRDEVEEVLLEHRKVGGVEKSEESFLKVLSDNFGMSKSEYMRMLEMALYEVKVSEQIDEKANEIASQVEKVLKETNGNFDEVAKRFSGDVKIEATGGLVSNKNIDGGRAEKAFSLEQGQYSEKFVSSNGDGYCYVKLNKKTDSQVDYISIKVPFLEFERRYSEIKENNKIQEYIEIK